MRSPSKNWMAVSALGLFVATSAESCPFEENACTDIAMASVNVTVLGVDDAPMTDASVRFAVDGGAAQDCENMGQGQYVCGWEVAGRLSITANREGYSEARREVAVEHDECHVIGQTLELKLELAAHFAEARVYSSILIVDEVDCAAAEAQGINCARVVEFCPDGTLTIMVTDIVSSGTYARDAQGIALDCSDACDIPATMRFAHDAASDVLTDDYLHEDWVRVSLGAGFGSCD